MWTESFKVTRGALLVGSVLFIFIFFQVVEHWLVFQQSYIPGPQCLASSSASRVL